MQKNKVKKIAILVIIAIVILIVIFMLGTFIGYTVSKHYVDKYGEDFKVVTSDTLKNTKVYGDYSFSNLGIYKTPANYIVEGDIDYTGQKNIEAITFDILLTNTKKNKTKKYNVYYTFDGTNVLVISEDDIRNYDSYEIENLVEIEKES